MLESPLDQPVMTFAPDGYIPGRIQLEKVKGSKPSLVQPERDNHEAPTRKTNDFILKNIARVSTIAGIGIVGVYGTAVGEGIATGNTNKIIFGAVGAGLTLGAVGLNATMIDRLRR
ncbi:MAG: hypothetical protein KBD51_02735 [Candidatus Levybacteria bacterium]|nr:hypothetical protein [Candidatus Levybacteria bacterium]